MSLMDIINKAAAKESTNFSTIVFTLLVPKFIENGKKVNNRFIEIVFEYNLDKMCILC